VDIDRLSIIKRDRKRFHIPEEVSVFCYFFDTKSVQYRKNPDAALTSFRLAFGDRKDVLLIIKASGGNSIALDYQRFKTRANGFDNVMLIEETWSQDKTAAFMATIDVYVSLHRAEGFGLTCAEAMSMGKPVLASAYSGNLDFMTGYPGLVEGKIVQTLEKRGPYPQGSSWFEPNIEEAASKMLELLSPNRRRDFASLGLDLVNVLRPEMVAGTLNKLIEGLLQD
jgi:glycosyltransferase involved in cell wall biosynthesis